MTDPILTTWDVYWITRCDAVSSAAGLIFMLSTLTAAISIFAGVGCRASLNGGDQLIAPALLRLALWAGMLAALSGLVKAATPSTKEMCAIIALPAIANSEDVQGLGREVVDAALEWVRDLGPERGAEER